MLAGSQVTPVVLTPDTIVLFMTDGDGDVVTSKRNARPGWDPWRTVSPSATIPGAPVAAAKLSSTSVPLFVANRDGGVATAPGVPPN